VHTSAEASIDNMLLGIVLPVTTSDRIKSTMYGYGGGNTCCCFFETTTGRRVTGEASNYENPYGDVSINDQNNEGLAAAVITARMPKDKKNGNVNETDADSKNQEKEASHWRCAECGNDNELEEGECEMCASDRPDIGGGEIDSDMPTIVDQGGPDMKHMTTDPIIFDTDHNVCWRLPSRISSSNNATFLIEERRLAYRS